MEYPQTHTQKFNLKQVKKMIFFATPFPSGSRGVVATPLPLISGMTPLDVNFYHSFVALTLIGG